MQRVISVPHIRAVVLPLCVRGATSFAPEDRVLTRPISNGGPSHMVNNPDELRARRDAAEGVQRPGSRTERIVKMFPPADKIKAIKAEIATVTIGHGDYTKEVRIHPLNPKQMVQSYQLIRVLLLPIVGIVAKQSAGEKIEVADLLEMFGDNVDKIPELIFRVLERGNDVSLDWINEHMDLALDFMQIAPLFLEQNGMVKLHAGKEDQSQQNGAQVQDKPPLTEELPVPSLSSADGTDGNLN